MQRSTATVTMLAVAILAASMVADITVGIKIFRISQPALYAVVLLIVASPALAQSSMPDPELTPGATNPAVTQENLNQTICVRGWTRTVRPAEEYTQQLKRWGIEQYGYADHRLNQYQFDHLIPLEVGGAPADPTNLWPEPMIADDGWRADDKDLLEHVLNHLVCSHRLSLAAAQHAIAVNWKNAYTIYVTGG